MFDSKKKKILTYVLAMVTPLIIFMIASWINGFVPFGHEMINSYDSFSQYSGMLLEYARLLRTGNIFFSWGAGLGFNFFGTLAYYGMSPLNLLSLFATPHNYHLFIAVMTYLRFMLLGASMCFYLSHKKIKPLYVVLFSTIYALMGYTCTYYYNYIWIDSIIMLPLVIHGLDKLIDGKSPLFYLASLTITILMNFYIGYMICLFCLIWFIYRYVSLEKKKKGVIKTFCISSLLAGLSSMIVIVPSFFALLMGKSDLYSTIEYAGISRNVFTFFYTLTTGAYQAGDQSYGPALIYVTIFTVVLNVFFFFNKKFSTKEKIATLAVIIFFYLSFGVHFLNYAWQLFQRPIWWQSRFSFVFSFFLITVAAKTLMNIEKTDMPFRARMVLLALGIFSVLFGAYFKFQVVLTVNTYTYIFLGLSVLLMIEMFLLLDKKGFLPLLLAVTFLDLTANTYNSLKNNIRYKSYTDGSIVKDEVVDRLASLDDDEFYRFELTDDFTSDDGLYFGYRGLNYFNSVRNRQPIEFVQKLGVTVYEKCHIELLELDPVILSLLDIKYLYGDNVLYLDKVKDKLYKNKYALGLGFLGKSDVKNVELLDGEYDYETNKSAILSSLTGMDGNLYDVVKIDEFEETFDGRHRFVYKFKTEDDIILMPMHEGRILIDDEEVTMNEVRAYAYYKGRINLEHEGEKLDGYYPVEKGKDVTVEYTVMEGSDEKIEGLRLVMLHLDTYEKYMGALEGHALKVKTNTSPLTILEGTITNDTDYDYLFTSIPYEKGMQVFVDGKKYEPDVVLGALVGVPLEKGKHEIKITYVPHGLPLGAAITGLSLLASVFYLQRRKKVI